MIGETPSPVDPAATCAYLPPMDDASQPLADALPDPLEVTDAAVPPPATATEPMRLYLVDGSGYIFRAFHALPPLSRKSDGLPVGAVAGFCNMLWKFLADHGQGNDAKDFKGPTHLAVIFDKSEKTFRSEMYDQYKAHRPPAARAG